MKTLISIVMSAVYGSYLAHRGVGIDEYLALYGFYIGAMLLGAWCAA